MSSLLFTLPLSFCLLLRLVLCDQAIGLVYHEFERVSVIMFNFFQRCAVKDNLVAHHIRNAGSMHRYDSGGLLPGLNEGMCPFARWRVRKPEGNRVEATPSCPIVAGSSNLI